VVKYLVQDALLQLIAALAAPAVANTRSWGFPRESSIEQAGGTERDLQMSDWVELTRGACLSLTNSMNERNKRPDGDWLTTGTFDASFDRDAG